MTVNYCLVVGQWLWLYMYVYSEGVTAVALIILSNQSIGKVSYTFSG